MVTLKKIDRRGEGWDVANIVVMIVGAAVAVLYFYAASKIPTTPGDPIGPRTFPYLIAIGFLFSLGWMAVEEIRKRRRTQDAEELAVVQWPKVHVVGMIVVGTGLYYAALEPLGFLLATIIYLFALASVLDARRLVLNASVAIGFSAALYLLFSKLLKSSLPVGAIFG